MPSSVPAIEQFILYSSSISGTMKVIWRKSFSFSHKITVETSAKIVAWNRHSHEHFCEWLGRGEIWFGTTGICVNVDLELSMS